MNPFKEFEQKLITANQAVKLVKSGDWVDYNFGLAQPVALDKALAARKLELTDIKVRGGLAVRPLSIVEEDPLREVFCYNSWHLSGYERKLSDKGLCNYIPIIYRNMPLFYRKSLEVDVAMFTVAPMNDEGYFSFSFTNSASKAITERAKIVILEVNENLPAIKGTESSIHISDIDYVVLGDNLALPTLGMPETSDADRRIAELIVDEIRDGATIQLGIGALPNTVGSVIARSELKNLGMHTEMMVDAYMIMERAGKLTHLDKKIDAGQGVFSFCLGSQELYDWASNNKSLYSAPIDYTNNPHVMSQNDQLITINNCIEVDLYGQVTSETSGSRQISGTGGQLDFLTGGYLSNRGKSFICFTSTFMNKKTGQEQSRILPSFVENTVVTNPRTQAHNLVTEWGIADLAGRSTWERAERIIGIAHPDFREELISKADHLGIWRRSNKKQ